MLRIFKLIIQSLLVAYLVIFSVSNGTTITFKPFMNVAQYEIPLFLLVIITLFIGIIIGALAMYGEKIVLNGKIKKLNKEIKADKQEIERLQKITISQEEVEKASKEEKLPEVKDVSETTSVSSDIKDAVR